jgi:hypothetical protein
MAAEQMARFFAGFSHLTAHSGISADNSPALHECAVRMVANQKAGAAA